MEITSSPVRWTEENIIELIRKLRDELIKDFLDERYLRHYAATNINVKELSNIKIEFIKRSLKELMSTPVDTVHYNIIITQIKQTDTASLNTNEQLFFKEVEGVLKRHLY